MSNVVCLFGLLLQLAALVSLVAAEACTIEGDVRLADGNSTTDGRVEICRNGEWGTICDDFWSTPDAVVACRQLNLTADYAVALPLFGGGSGPIHYAGYRCTGNETHLVNCTANEIPRCFHAEDAGVRCPSEPECTETDIQLVNGQTSDDGHVQVCLRGHWGSVCDDRWDTIDATVVCRQLGHDGPSYPLISHGSEDPLPFHLDNVHCTGNESKLSDCDHLGFGVHNCAWEFEEAGVVCTNNTCENGTVHLVGSDDISRGRVEYCYNGSWYSVCASGWDEEEARVVCEALGYSSDIYLVSNFGRGTTPMLSQSVQCSADATTLSDCNTTELDAASQCLHVAGVICEAPCLFNGCNNCSEITCLVRSSRCGCDKECYIYGDCCPDVAHVENCTVSECETGEIRLVGGVTNSTGRLELCANGIWGRVCNRLGYWGSDNARVVCRQLGFSEDGAYFIYTSVLGLSERAAVVGEVHCVGTEPELLECSHSSFGYHFCSPPAPQLDIAISCYDERTSCEDGEVRLRDGTDSSNGRVEYCLYRTWFALCNNEWDDSNARVVCGQLSYDPDDSRAVEGFGNIKKVPVLPFKVACNGTETNLTTCTATRVSGECDTAGVTCGRSSNTERCTGSSTVAKEDRFGVCEAYGANVGQRGGDICAHIWRLGVDFVYIGNSRNSPSDVSSLLNNVSSIMANYSQECVELVSRVTCQYYIPWCGNITHNPLPPSSLCQEECMYVQSKCEAAWNAVALAFGFIPCNDTSRLLFPVPNCCTGAGIELTLPPSSSTQTGEPVTTMEVHIHSTSSHSSRGAVAGAVVGTLMFIILAIGVPMTVIILVIRYKNMYRKKLLNRVQMDILAMPGHDQSDLNSCENHIYDDPIGIGKESEPEDKVFLFEVSDVDANPYSIPQSAAANTMSGNLLQVPRTRARVPSHYLRELTLGKFVIKQEDITLLESIGEGEFGIVYRARLKAHGTRSREVAIKTMKGEFDQMEVDKFVEESLKMSRFRHSHVMGLIGVCLDSGSAPFIIMPYMANGSLLKYLKRERKNLVLSDDDDEDEVKAVCKRLTVMCSQIASGMEYLAAEKYVHRDLAARNCMIDTHFLIKITDFGLSEDVFVRNYFRQGRAEEVVRLPVKWMAPESLSDGHFSEKSDVWSFGVTMWEIFSGGKAPFPGTDPLTLMQRLEEGERMAKPYNTACTDEIYVMMKNCWEKAPEDRPTFKQLYIHLNKSIEHMAGYLEMGFNPFKTERGANNGQLKEGEHRKEEEEEEVEEVTKEGGVKSTTTAQQ